MNLIYKDLGIIPYKTAYDMQFKIQEDVQNGSDDHLLLMEHPKVITIGLNADSSNLLVSESFLIQQGYDVFHIRRGGDVTYHGPGQIVGYLIFNMKKNHGGSIRTFVHKIEQTLIDVLAEAYGITAMRDEINAGVFIGLNKIAAIGLSVNKGVTMHGFALNVNTNLGDYAPIVPCGLKTRSVTSVEKELGHQVDLEQLKLKLNVKIRNTFEFNNKKGEIEI